MRSVSACLSFLVAKTHFGKVHGHVEKFLPGVSVADVIEALDRGRHEGGQEHGPVGSVPIYNLILLVSDHFSRDDKWLSPELAS